MAFRDEPAGAHEIQRFGDAVGEFLIALACGRVLDEAQHPAMDVVQVGIAAAGEGAQQVQRRRRLAIGLHQPLRIGRARLGRELDAVDVVAAIGRQRHAVVRLGRRTSAAWRTGRRCGRPSPPASRRRRSAPPPSAGARGRCRGYCRRWNSVKLSAQSPPCSRNALPSATSASAPSGCAPRRRTPAADNSRELRLDSRQRRRPDSPGPGGSACPASFAGSRAATRLSGGI